MSQSFSYKLLLFVKSWFHFFLIDDLHWLRFLQNLVGTFARSWLSLSWCSVYLLQLYISLTSCVLLWFSVCTQCHTKADMSKIRLKGLDVITYVIIIVWPSYFLFCPVYVHPKTCFTFLGLQRRQFCRDFIFNRMSIFVWGFGGSRFHIKVRKTIPACVVWIHKAVSVSLRWNVSVPSHQRGEDGGV